MNAKATHIFFSKNISIYAIFNDLSFYNMLTNDIVSFVQLGPCFFFYLHTKAFLKKESTPFWRKCFPFRVVTFTERFWEQIICFRVDPFSERDKRILIVASPTTS